MHKPPALNLDHLHKTHLPKNPFTKKSCKKPCKKPCKKSCKKITRKKGGFGPVSNPFIAPPKPWDATGYSYFFPFSKNGVTPGGIQPYYGRQFASPQTTSRCQQKGGNFRDFIPQPILNTFRISENELLNLINIYLLFYEFVFYLETYSIAYFQLIHPKIPSCYSMLT